jgi:hypothetical protein
VSSTTTITPWGEKVGKIYSTWNLGNMDFAPNRSHHKASTREVSRIKMAVAFLPMNRKIQLIG